MSNLLIRQATCNDLLYTPLQFQCKTDLIGKSKKDKKYKLYCSAGHELSFVRDSIKTRNKKEFIVSAHFRHKSDSERDSCILIKKYAGVGETDEHFQTKKFISEHKFITFQQECKNPDCHDKKIWKRCDWVGKTEVVIGKWIFDVVFYDSFGNIICIVEILHWHSTKGEKRNWLLQQPFLYFEVKTQYNLESLEMFEKEKHHVVFDVWDSKEDYLCGLDQCILDTTRRREVRFNSDDEKEELKKWRNCDLNQILKKQQPQFVLKKSNKCRGLHLKIIMFAYPHQINWIQGSAVFDGSWKHWILKKENYDLRDKCLEKTKNRSILSRYYTAGASDVIKRVLKFKKKHENAVDLNKIINDYLDNDDNFGWYNYYEIECKIDWYKKNLIN